MGIIEVTKKFIQFNWMLEKAVKEVLERLPLRFRYGISYGPTFRYWLAFLRESERWDRDRLESYQIEQCKDLLMHAGKDVPFYRKLFREYGFNPKKIQSLEDIKILPYIDKKTVKERHNEFLTENVRKNRLIPANTSGTSGIPLVVYGTKETEEKHWATVVNLWSRIGYTPVSRTIFIEGNIRKGKKVNVPFKRYANRMIISSNYFIDKWIDKYIGMINNFRPEYIVGFPHTIAVFASHIKKRKQTIYNGLKGIIVYAENIYKWQREIIEGVFGARVFSDYGAAEKVIHGGGCEHSDAYHLYPQYGYTEYIKLRDSCYELVGTGFINYAMPLIRYRTGDVCTEANKGCPVCGRAYDVLPSVEGRIADFLVNKEGEIFSVYLDINYDIFKEIERFQLYQDTPGEVELRLWSKSKNINNVEIIANAINSCFGSHKEKIKLKVLLMDEEEPVSLRKFRMVQQKLNIADFI